MSEEYGSDFISITDEDGKEYELEVLAELDYNGSHYLALVPAEEEGAESRRKGEGVDSRKEDCHCHSQTELTVEHARCATHERHGNKHEHHDERD